MSLINSHQFYAMGSHMGVWLESDKVDLQVVEDHFREAEARLSRFQPDSELMRLNGRSEEWVPVSSELWAIITKSIALADNTDGLFDPTLLPEMKRAGYQHSFNSLTHEQAQTDTPEQKASHLFRYRDIGLDEAQQAVWLPAGVQLDLGGIAKGYTAQEVVNKLSPHGACLVDAGGDLVAGQAPSGLRGWPVGISAPYNGGDIADERPNMLRMWLTYSCLATSGIDYRQWQTGNGRKHHIIDPRTGTSAETDLLTVSVMMADACEAEAWATTSLILGQTVAHHLMTQYGIEGLFINQDHQAVLTENLRPHVQWEKESPVQEVSFT